MNLDLMVIKSLYGITPFLYITIPTEIAKIVGVPDWKMMNGNNTEYQLRIRTLEFKIIHVKSLNYLHLIFKPSISALYYYVRNMAYLRLKSIKEKFYQKATRLLIHILMALLNMDKTLIEIKKLIEAPL